MKRRRRARELTLQMLYAWEVSGNALELVLEELAKNHEEEEGVIIFSADLLKKTAEHKETLDRDVAAVVENWEFARIALIDRLILRMALCELLYFDEIPPKVTINEAIELAKEYSTAQSGRFINGILDSLYQTLKIENKMTKRGRGLIE